MKRNNGIITIEAAISLTAFIFCILFFLNFAKVYMAQNIVAYGAMESCRQYSMDYYKMAALGSTGAGGLVAEILDFWADGEDSGATEADLEAGDVFMLQGGGSVPKIEKYFAASISGDLNGDWSQANRYLEGVGIEGGMSGLDFGGTALLDSQDKIVVHITYKVKLLFPFFGMDEIEMEEEAASRLWKFVKWSPK